MSKVVRLSDKLVNDLEDFRNINLEICRVMLNDFPNQAAEIEKWKRMNLNDLLDYAIFNACFYSRDNLSKM